ncbi:glutathione S-transferase 4-like [Miscanthus floridulus]|uniref:glutathione S-transferase 4-like n=1 Tax=Miscanthus floridulus TaxID=154761 RepID=UPI00345A0975
MPKNILCTSGGAISPFVSRALLCLEEAGVDYELVPMNMEAGHHRRSDLGRNARTPQVQAELLGAGSMEDSAMVDMWLQVEAHQHHPAAAAIARECIAAPTLAACPTRPYLAGDFSLADLSHFTVMHYFMGTEYAALVEACPHVKAWWEELAVRPVATESMVGGARCAAGGQEGGRVLDKWLRVALFSFSL